MKNIIHLIINIMSLIAMTCGAQELPGQVHFSYANDIKKGGGGSEPTFAGGAMFMTEDAVRRFDNCRITEIDIVNGDYINADEVPVTIFFTRSLEETPFRTFQGEVDIDHPYEYKTYVLPEPLEIKAGEPFYAGFTVFAPGWSSDYECNIPVITDGIAHTGLPGGFIGHSATSGAPEDMEWKDDGEAGGMICIRLKIEGDELPVNTVELRNIRVQESVTTSTLYFADLELCNLGVNPITDIDVSYCVGGDSIVRHEIIPLADSRPVWLCVQFAVEEEGLNLPIKFKIEKVNGEPAAQNVVIERTVKLHALAPDNGYERKMVIEEGSGRGCGWCVRGIVSMERMMAKYPDSFIPITIHHPAHGEDTAPIGYDAFWDKGITSIPSSLINRNVSSFGVTDPLPTLLERYHEQIISSPAIAEIGISGYTLENGWLTASSEVEFALDEDDGSYSVCYVITEDNVGAIVQNNAYSGSNEDWDGWETLGTNVVTYYNYLARGISNFEGTPIELPAHIDSGVKYCHTDKVDLSKVSDFNKLSLIALVINDKEGFIENGCRIALSGLDGIKSVAEDNDGPAEYYDLTGRRVTGTLSPGVYIRRQGAVSTKIAVK